MSDTLFRCRKCGPDMEPPSYEPIEGGGATVHCHGETVTVPLRILRQAGPYRVLVFGGRPPAPVSYEHAERTGQISTGAA